MQKQFSMEELRKQAEAGASIDLHLGDTNVELDNKNGIAELLNRQIEMESSVIELTRAVSSLRTEMTALTELVHGLQTSTDHVKDSLNKLVSLGIMSGNLEVATASSGQYTRQVASSVPAAIIRGIWYDHNPKEPLPVAFTYLKKLCDATMGTFGDNTKREIGSILSKYIDQIESNNQVHGAMLLLMCSNADMAMAEMRRLLLATLKILGTWLAFMLPSNLTSILARVSTMNQGYIIYDSKANSKDMVKPNDGYDRISVSFLDKGPVMKAIKLLNASGFSKANCTQLYHSIATGGVQSDGKIAPSEAKEGTPLLDLFAPTPTKSASVRVSSSVQSLKLDDIFSPMKTT